MSDWDPLFGSRCPSGVYLIDTGQRDAIIRGNAFPATYHVAILKGVAASSREGFFTEIARAMRFPEYFGRNWDAVYDCLTDPGVLPATGTAIVLDGFDRFVAAEPEQWQIAMKVLQNACDFWRPLDRPLYVLLSGAGEPLAGIPVLPRDCLAAAADGAFVDPS